jgi:hypothetical protein
VGAEASNRTLGDEQNAGSGSKGRVGLVAIIVKNDTNGCAADIDSGFVGM